MKAIVMWKLSRDPIPDSELASRITPAKGKTALREVLAGRDMKVIGDRFVCRRREGDVWVPDGEYYISGETCYRTDGGAWTTEDAVCEAHKLRCVTVTKTDVSRYLTKYASDSGWAMRDGVYMFRNVEVGNSLAELVQKAMCGVVIVTPQPAPAEAAAMAVSALLEQAKSPSLGKYGAKDVLKRIGELRGLLVGLDAAEADATMAELKHTLETL